MTVDNGQQRSLAVNPNCGLTSRDGRWPARTREGPWRFDSRHLHHLRRSERISIRIRFDVARLSP